MSGGPERKQASVKLEPLFQAKEKRGTGLTIPAFKLIMI